MCDEKCPRQSKKRARRQQGEKVERRGIYNGLFITYSGWSTLSVSYVVHRFQRRATKGAWEGRVKRNW